MKHHHKALCFILPGVLLGCTPTDPDRDSLKGLDKAQASVAPSSRDTQAPPALMGNTPISAADLANRLEEAAGSVILEEVVLGRMLDKAIADSGIKISPQDIDAEQQLLAQTLADEVQLTPPQAKAMIDNLRKARGLGPVRFADLMARNAKLRVLSRPQVEVTNEEIDQALAAEFGAHVRLRIIAVSSQHQASDIRDTITEGLNPPPPSPTEDATPVTPASLDPMLRPVHIAPADMSTVTLRFSQAALESSKDSSAPRGGLIPSISPVDQGLPSSVRNALAAMQPGDLSAVLSTDSGYMLVLYESKTDGKGVPTPEDRLRVADRVHSRKERIAMDHLARQLLGVANVSVMDPSLRWSWEARPRQ